MALDAVLHEVVRKADAVEIERHVIEGALAIVLVDESRLDRASAAWFAQMRQRPVARRSDRPRRLLVVPDLDRSEAAVSDEIVARLDRRPVASSHDARVLPPT